MIGTTISHYQIQEKLASGNDAHMSPEQVHRQQGAGEGLQPALLRKAAKALIAAREKEVVLASDIASCYAAAGDKEEAFKWLNVALQEHDRGLLALRTNMAFESLRSDPRYAQLVKRVGLP